MIFKDIKAGYPVYIFDREQITYVQGKAKNVGFPYISPKMNNTMVIDVTIENGQNIATYTFAENSETGYAGNVIISPNKECILREIEAKKSQSEDIIASIEQHKAVVEQCNNLLMEHNQSYKEKAVNEERIKSIEDSINDIKAILLQKNNIG